MAPLRGRGLSLSSRGIEFVEMEHNRQQAHCCGSVLSLVADPDVLRFLLIFLVFDLLYRLVAMLDAYRLGVDASVGSSGTRMLSMAGLVALVVVLVGSHVAIAQPVMFANDVYAAIEANAGDDSEVLTPEELVELGGEDFIVAVDVDERLVEQLRRRTVDGVAHLRPVDGDDEEVAVAFGGGVLAHGRRR